MTRYSLRARMMILILAPTLLLGLLLSASFIIHRYSELQTQAINAGTSIVQPLAIVSKEGMLARNRDTLRQLINLLHLRHSDIVRSITVFDAKNKLFVTSNYNYDSAQLQLPQNVPIPNVLMLNQRGDSLILHAPVVSEDHFADEANTPADQTNHIGYIAIDLDLHAVRLQQYKEALISASLLLFCLCIAILLAYRLICVVTGPIRNMVDTVDRIRRGQLDSRVKGQMLGELDTLKNGINSMAMSLAAYHEEMQQNIDQATSDLRETLEQMEIQNIELGLAKKRAQEAARIKSEFLANMSHELRTPLNGVIGFARQTLKTELTPTQYDYLQTIQRSANNLLTIINDVLDFSKLEAEKLVLEHIPFLLRETLDEVIVLLAHTAHEKGLELILSINNDVPEQVVGDPMRFQQVLTNILGNAIKFTENGNVNIHIDLHSHDNQHIKLRVAVHDTGIGITEQQQSQLFQVFKQADASISRRHGGTGLGLVITQKLVKEMGGDISFHSKLGQGSTFKFHITLDLNEKIPDHPPAIQLLSGKRLAYIETSPTVTKATLDMLSITPLHVIHSPTIVQLPPGHYDILLIGVPISYRNNLADHRDKLIAALKIADRVILALPSQSQVNAESLKQMGAYACLVKPISSQRLFPLLLKDNPRYLLLPPTTTCKTPRLPLIVMAVDDNPANLKLIGTLLEEQVEKTILCESGEEAIALAHENHLDMILMDIQMPGMDGIRANELIHQIPHHLKTPIIAVTAHAVSGQREHLLAAGMDGYLAKPIDEIKLRDTLSRHYIRQSKIEPALPTVTHQDEVAPSLSWPLALRQAADKEDLARELLQMLLDFLPQVKQRVRAVVAGAEDTAILDLIHKLHGSCSYSGVPRLKKLCCYIEQQLRQHIHPRDLEPEWLELLDEMENVSDNARAYLADVEHI